MNMWEDTHLQLEYRPNSRPEQSRGPLYSGTGRVTWYTIRNGYGHIGIGMNPSPTHWAKQGSSTQVLF